MLSHDRPNQKTGSTCNERMIAHGLRSSCQQRWVPVGGPMDRGLSLSWLHGRKEKTGPMAKGVEKCQEMQPATKFLLKIHSEKNARKGSFGLI